MFSSFVQAHSPKADSNCGVADAEPLEDASLVQAAVIQSKLRCEFCDFDFLDSAKLFHHEASHDPSNGYECAFCSITAPTTKTLSTHWSTECPFELYDKRRHINVKTLYVCNVCEERFTSLDDLYEHR